MLGGDASVDVPQGWRVYLATGLNFREKNRASFESIGTRRWLQLPTLPLYYDSLLTGSQRGRKKIRQASEWESECRDSASEASGTRGSL